MTRTRLEYLFQLCVKNEATTEERQEMLDLLELPEHEDIAKQLLYEAFLKPEQMRDISPETRNTILNNIYNSDGNTRREHHTLLLNRRIIKFTAIAATILVVFSIGSFLLFRKAKQSPLVAKTGKGSILPGGNKAMLILADGSKINLNDAKNGLIAKQSGISIKKATSGQLVYILAHQHSSSKVSVNQLVYNTIVTPVGGQYQVDLPDGTKVWLNAASSLKYPTAFATNERRVELTGEGYFEVAKNKAKPFRVVTNKQEIEVLGTHFNINAYADESAVKTTLLEGSVKVSAHQNAYTPQQPTILKPGEQSILDNTGLAVQNVDVDDAVAWKNGYFNFDEDFQSIMRKLSRWYAIDVVYATAVDPNLSFGGKISRSKNINAVLNIIAATGNVHFKIDGRRVTVMK